MGQYYVLANVDKQEFIDPHAFGDMLKLLEFGCSGSGTMCGLAILLADGNGRGNGDLETKSKIPGRWKGDRIVVAGDYADPDNFLPEGMKEKLYQIDLAVRMKKTEGMVGQKLIEEVELAEKYARRFCNVYHACDYGLFRDINDDVVLAMADDEFLRGDLKERLAPRVEQDYGRHIPAKLRKKLGFPAKSRKKEKT